MSKKTNKNSGEIPDLSQFIINPLYKDVVDEIIKDSQEYEYGQSTPLTNLHARINDILRGLSNGTVNRLIYYNDTNIFYEDYKREINQLLYEMLDATGLSISELFGDKWDKSDPLAIEQENKNLLVWFAYEEIAQRLSDYMEQE